MSNVESGKVKNEKQITKTAVIAGKKVTETAKIDKDTGRVLQHQIDGKDVPKPLQYNRGNADVCIVNLLISINQHAAAIRQNLQELNYRHNEVHPLADKQVQEGIK